MRGKKQSRLYNAREMWKHAKLCINLSIFNFSKLLKLLKFELERPLQFEAYHVGWSYVNTCSFQCLSGIFLLPAKETWATDSWMPRASYYEQMFNYLFEVASDLYGANASSGQLKKILDSLFAFLIDKHNIGYRVRALNLTQ